MKKIWLKLSAVFLCGILFILTAATPVSAYQPFVKDEFVAEKYYKDYTFQQFYAMSDEELEKICYEMETNYTEGNELTFFPCFYLTQDARDTFSETYLNEDGKCEGELLDLFCEEFLLPRQYIECIDVNFYEQMIGANVTAYEAFTIETIYYQDDNIRINGLNKEEEKVCSIIALLLSLNPDCGVRIERLGSGIKPAIYGDANRDNKIDITDAVYMLKYVSGAVKGDTSMKISCDLNTDGLVDENDILLLLKFLTRIIDTLPYTA